MTSNIAARQTILLSESYNSGVHSPYDKNVVRCHQELRTMKSVKKGNNFLSLNGQTESGLTIRVCTYLNH